MITESWLEREHAVKLKSYSRENERPCICDSCNCDPDLCGKEITECEQEVYDEL